MPDLEVLVKKSFKNLTKKISITFILIICLNNNLLDILS